MTDLFLRSVDGNDVDNGLSWALAKEQSDNVDGVTSIDAAGDTIYVSDNHAESQAAAIVIELAGTNNNPEKMLCVDDTSDPASPSSLAETATIISSNNTISIKGAAYIYGITFSSYVNLDIGLDVQGSHKNQTYEKCVLKLNRTGASTPSIRVNDASGSTAAKKLFKDCKIYKATNSQSLNIFSGFAHFVNLTLAAGSSTPLAFVKFIGTNARSGAKVLVESSDFSAYATTFDFVSDITSGSLVAINCKLPPLWSGSLLSNPISASGARVSMYNCDDGDTNYRLWIEDYAGSIVDQTNTLIKTGGASDGTTPISWKLTANANANELVGQFQTDEISFWNETIGSAITVSIEVLHNAQGTGTAGALLDSEIKLEAQYLGVSGFPQGVMIDNGRATILTPPVDQPTSSATWDTTGMASPVKQKLSLTFTPREKGVVYLKLFLMKASATVYADPLPVIS